MISRRSMLAGSLMSAGGFECEECGNIRAGAYAAGLHFGSDSDVLFSSAPDYARLILRNCDLFAPNLSWKLLAPTPEVTLDRIDPNIGLAAKNGLRLTGYHLLWHEATPPWFEALDRSQAEQAVLNHIDALAARFGADSFSWNVVNEAIAPAQGRPDGLRPNAFLEKLGTGYFDLAFDRARTVAPQILRVYNDYNLELATPEHAARRAALLGLLDGLLRRGVPVQAVGLQCHLRAASFAASFDASVFRDFLRELAGRGLTILITELDVFDASTAPIPIRDRVVAEVYGRFLDTALEQAAIAAVVTWGLSDRYSWINDPRRRSYSRPDGLPSRPLPFDDALRPKSALTALLAALAAAPPRPMFRPV